ncbi:unnamed protein product, partial [Brassica oleracea var. botrytis]
REETSSCKRTSPNPTKGTPFQNSQPDLPTEALNEAREELREVMIQYTSCADPSESAARKERLRQAEQNGQFEESVAQMARASLANLPARNREDDQPNSPERVPALLRLGQPPSPPLQMENERIPNTGRRKPGRPPGSKRVSSSPKTLTGASSRKRKLKQTKAPPCRR